MKTSTLYLALLLLCLLGIVAVVKTDPNPAPLPERIPAPSFQNMSPLAPPAYLHAVVPGGVWTAKAAGLPHGNVRVLREDIQGYVNYRKDGHIYWTKHPVTIHAGETVIEEGGVMIRARCGNTIVTTPHVPVETEDIADLLDVPVVSDVPNAPTVSNLPTVADWPVAPNAPSVEPLPTGFLPIYYPTTVTVPEPPEFDFALLAILLLMTGVYCVRARRS